MNGTNAPVGVGIDIDRKDPDNYLVSVGVAGLGLPDKDYYTNADERFVKIRAAYVDHIEKMLGFAGAKDAHARAEKILALETALSKPQWERAQRRDRDKTYNVIPFAELATKYPGYDFAAHFKAQGMRRASGASRLATRFPISCRKCCSARASQTCCSTSCSVPGSTTRTRPCCAKARTRRKSFPTSSCCATC